MNIREQWAIGGAAVGFAGAVGLAVLGYKYVPALMAPAVTFGLLMGATAIGAFLGNRAFDSEARNYRR